MRQVTMWRAGRRVLAAALVLVAAAACKSDGDVIGPGDADLVPRAFDARYEWVLHGWESGGVAPIGHAGVTLIWALPPDWNGEPFRVYARQSGTGNYTAISTVTSCADSVCGYTDLNVAPGQAYDYFVATVDERRDEETASEALRVSVPSGTAPQRPGAPEVIALDNALYITWAPTGAERYRVFLEQIAGETVFFEVGETDGTSFLDVRAENGTTYGYRVAAIDTLGQFSERGAVGSGVPRPDYSAEAIWAHGDLAESSGFRFQPTEDTNPIVSGTSSTAQWRMEEVGGVLSIVPLGQTQVTEGVFTSALTCGPAADADCVAVTQAPAGTAFGAGAVPVVTANTYVLWVVGDDGNRHYGKIRVMGTGVDAGGATYAVFDWAYQLQANQPSLSVGR